MYQLVPRSVDSGFGIRNFHSVVDSDKLVSQTVAKFEHVSVLGDVVRMSLWWCSRGPCAFR